MSNYDSEHFSWPIGHGFGEGAFAVDSVKIRTVQDIKMLPEPLARVMLLQREIAMELKQHYVEKFPIKGAEISFSYEDKDYVLYPSAFGIEDSQLEVLSADILEALNVAGCSRGSYIGYMD